MLHVFETLHTIHIFCSENTLISLMIELFLHMLLIHHYHYALLYPHFYAYSFRITHFCISDQLPPTAL